MKYLCDINEDGDDNFDDDDDGSGVDDDGGGDGVSDVVSDGGGVWLEWRIINSLMLSALNHSLFLVQPSQD